MPFGLPQVIIGKNQFSLLWPGKSRKTGTFGSPVCDEWTFLCSSCIYECKSDVLNVGLSIPEVWCLGLLWLLLSSSGGLESLWHLYPWWGGLQLEKTFWEVIFTLWRQSLSSEFMEPFGSLSLNLFVPKPAGTVCRLFSSTPLKISSVDKRFLYGVKFLVLVFYFFFLVYTSSMTLMNGTHSSDYPGVACLLLQCCLTARSLGPKLSKGAGLFQELFWSLTTHWFQYHKLHFLQWEGRMRKWSKIKLKKSKKNPTKNKPTTNNQ